MFNHRISPLFSVAVLSLSLAFAGGGTFMLIDSLPKVPHKEIKPEALPAPVPTMEVAPPTPDPVQVKVEEPAPVKATIVQIPPKVTKHPTSTAAIAKAAQPCELVCEDNWNDSVLFVGGRYKNCKCR